MEEKEYFFERAVKAVVFYTIAAIALTIAAFLPKRKKEKGKGKGNK